MAGSETYGRAPGSRKRLRFSSLGKSPPLGDGQKAVQRELQHLFPQDLGLERFADQRSARAEHGNFHALQVRVEQQPLLGGGTLAPQPAALPDGERHPELGFHQPGQREVQVIAAQQQVLAHGGTGEIHQVALAG